MGVGFEGFMTGFLNEGSEIISKRKEKAENYFDAQMEKAATLGSTSLKERRAQHRSISNLSNNLITQARMPEAVVRGLANDGPEALNAAYEIYSTSVQNGVPVDEDFWTDVYDFSTEVNTDQPLSEFLKQVSGLYPANLQAVQEEGGDPFSAFVSSGLGLNAMDRARSRLETTEVEGGYSARDLLNMTAGPQNTRPLGDVNYTIDLEAIQAREDAATASRKTVMEDLDPERRRKEGEDFLSALDEAVTQGANDTQNDPAYSGMDKLAIEDELRPKIQAELALQWLENYGTDDLEWIKSNNPVVYRSLPQEIRDAFEKGEITTIPQEGEITETPTQESDVATEVVTPEVITTPLEVPVPPADEPQTGEPQTASPEREYVEGSLSPPPQDIPMLDPGERMPDISDQGEIYTFREQLPDGMVVYEDQNGIPTPPMNPYEIPSEVYVKEEAEAQPAGPAPVAPDSILVNGTNYQKFRELETGRVIYKDSEGNFSPPLTPEQAMEAQAGEGERPKARPTDRPIGAVRPRDNPPARVAVGNKRLRFTNDYDEQSDSWVYKDPSTGKEILIPVQR